MKKTLCFALAACVLFVLCACGAPAEPVAASPSTPEEQEVMDTVDSALSGLSSGELLWAMVTGGSSSLPEEAAVVQPLLTLLSDHFSYTATDILVDGDYARVAMRVTYGDLSGVFNDIVSSSLGSALGGLISGSGVDLDALIQKAEQAAAECVESGSIPTVEKDVTIYLEKSGDSWVLTPNDDFMNAISGNLYGPVKNMSSLLNSLS